MSVEEYVQSAVSPLGVMEQPLNLLQEMNTRGVKASPRCTSALLDVSFSSYQIFFSFFLSFFFKQSFDQQTRDTAY
jgi:hypothetical protein